MDVFNSSQRKQQERWHAEVTRKHELQLEIGRREYERNERYLRELERERQLAKEAEIKRLNDEHEKLREQEQQANSRIAASRNISPKSVRRLRELIRTRYRLDVEVWNLRNVQLADRNLVMEEGKKADAILQEIYSIVETWEESAFTPQEWIVARRVKELVFLPDKRIWEKNPPWE